MTEIKCYAPGCKGKCAVKCRWMRTNVGEYYLARPSAEAHEMKIVRKAWRILGQNTGKLKRKR